MRDPFHFGGRTEKGPVIHSRKCPKITEMFFFFFHSSAKPVDPALSHCCIVKIGRKSSLLSRTVHG